MRRLVAALLACALAGPAMAEVNREALAAERPPKLLSEFGFFTDAAADRLAPGVVPYEITAPLFTDHAEKDRFVFTPAPYRTGGALDFPEGAALIKTFRYGARKVETRVLVHRAGGWAAYPYVWNEAGTEARLKIAGADLDLQTRHGPIACRVPNMNQCKACHVDAAGTFQPVGPKIRNLNAPGQLARLVEAGVLAKTRADAPLTPDCRDETLPLETRARAYLDANCAHCHAPGLPADNSALYLHWEEDRPLHLGVRKPPVAAGRGSGGLAHGIVPGDPDASILVHRMGSTDPAVMMPEIGRSVVDPQGLALVRDWITAMK